MKNEVRKKIKSKWTVEKGRWDRKKREFYNRTYDKYDRELEMVIDRTIIRFDGGPTGHESYYIEHLFTDGQPSADAIFCICAGTINTWPRCDVPALDVWNFLVEQGFLAEEDEDGKTFSVRKVVEQEEKEAKERKNHERNS